MEICEATFSGEVTRTGEAVKQAGESVRQLLRKEIQSTVGQERMKNTRESEIIVASP
jgi:hypothetical protein